MTDAQASPQEIESRLSRRIQSMCAPIWWESERRYVVNNGTMCLVQTPERLIGITNDHVFKIYQRHKAEKSDIFCQLGSAPFDPIENLIARNEPLDIATFSIPQLTLSHWGGKVMHAPSWPPEPIREGDWVAIGGFPEVRRTVSSESLPTSMSNQFLYLRTRTHSSTPQQVTFHIDPERINWLPNVSNPIARGTNLSGMSGGPCVRLVPDEKRIEFGGIISQGNFDLGILYARQLGVVSPTGQIAEGAI